MRRRWKSGLSLLLVTVLCIVSAYTGNGVKASTEVYNTNSNIGNKTIGIINNKEKFPIDINGQLDIPYPERLPKEKDTSNRIKSFSASDYAGTKKVADKIASYLTTTYGETSVQYALIDNGKIVLSGNAGNYSLRDKSISLSNDTMYGIASVSKMFTTASVMKLVEEGKVSLDTPVVNYIPEFKMKDDRYKNITVRMLLNHSSGLMGTTNPNIILMGDNDTFYHDHLLKQLENQRLKADPGAYSVYCNDGFALAEILIERVTGIDYTTYITNTFLKPLSMDDTKTPVSQFDSTRLARIYSADMKNELPQENFNAIGTAGLYSNAENLCIFAQTFMERGNGILTLESRKAMENKEYEKGIWTDSTDNVLGYGLGWDCVDTYPFNQYNIKALTKAGDSNFYHTNMIVLPDKNMAIAVVSSGGSSDYNLIAGQQILLNALKEKGDISEIKPDKTYTTPVKAPLPNELKKYEGYYLTSGSILSVKMKEDGTLCLTNPQYSEYGSQTMIYTGNGKFVSSDGSVTLDFVEESNGVTYIRRTSYDMMKYVGQTACCLYIGQKIQITKPSNEILSAWKMREGKSYYLVSEKYSSAIYLSGCLKSELTFTKGLEGYVDIHKIVDENNAISELNGPGSLARDLKDYHFFKKGNTEYFDVNGYVFVEGKVVKNLPSKKKFTCKIKNDGYAVWYNVGKGENKRSIKVKIPSKAAFMVYDSEGNLVLDSYIANTNKVTLPRNGTIAFTGNADSLFEVEYQ
ncbi:serine hydrolase domain-containing protein [Anaeromicropila herbilytica]|uniref:Serine hydrolase n=1 Tax=Anaeromicropila herbilytica TaxID=2785025 RepID=A0A7R7ELX9_9FIRM|nr:serine hydrolase domain-containing protein [Anaeromicropila herbilytica]BCN31390.1 serine hydrolase [Anaeromicropila herbilytica]